MQSEFKSRGVAPQTLLTIFQKCAIMDLEREVIKMAIRDWIFIFIIASANGFVVPKSAWIILITLWALTTIIEFVKQRKGKKDD